MASRLVLALAVLLAGEVHGHGTLVKPAARSVQFMLNTTNGLAVAGSCKDVACAWYSQDVTIPGPTTNCNKDLRTMGVTCGDKNPIDFACGGPNGTRVPWCAPGTAPVRSPCGIFGGGFHQNSRDMRDLPAAIMDTWSAGSVVSVAFAVTANHGGGYSYRLCPADSDLEEECFQANPMDFHGDSQWIVDSNMQTLATFPAVRTSDSTWPKGSTWTRNPIPQEMGFGNAIPGLPWLFGRGPFNVSVVDTVVVPANLKTGHYVLSLRWDAEMTRQVWQGCSDIMIVSKEDQAKKNAPLPEVKQTKPRASRYVCSGNSLGLDITECDAWVDFYDSLGGPGWQDCSDLRLDPCSCVQKNWGHTITCASLRNYKHITEIYLMKNNLTGSIPEAISAFTQLAALDLDQNFISGTLPSTFGDTTSLQAIWLDHNPLLGGEIPANIAQLTGLYAFELHMCNFTGTVPAMQFTDIADCSLMGNNFKCPLPPGAETCGISCQ